MTFKDIPTPEAYKESADFRFFLNWIDMCLSKVQYHIDNLIDLLDPLRCPRELLWMLADTCGYKYDERASVAFNRLVVMHFATLIMNRGSHTGMTFAAELNLAQFNLQKYAEENPILEDRLEDTSIPTNSASVTAYPELGYIDLVYYSENIPTDVCLEYVRPVGMYCFSHAGVVVNARTKISVDARLTNSNDVKIKPGPSFVAHYRRNDYAKLQRYDEFGELELRRPVYYRNMESESEPAGFIDPGYRSLFSLQLCNNEHIVKALLPSLDEYDPIFSLGYEPQRVDVMVPDDYLKHPETKPYNLRVDRSLEESFTPRVYTVEQADSVIEPHPAVNPVMFTFGDAISLNEPKNTAYTKVKQDTGEIIVVRREEEGGSIPRPSLISTDVNGTSVTVTYEVPRLEEGSYSSIKLAAKHGEVPISVESADVVATVPEPTSSTRIATYTISNLDANTQYYFVVFAEADTGIWVHSNPISCVTGHEVVSMISSVSVEIVDWDGSESTVLNSGTTGRLTAAVESSHIVFRMYNSDSVIYSWTSFIGSSTEDASKIRIAFVTDPVHMLAKPSFIYETSENVYSYNQENPTDTEMAAIYTWLQNADSSST